MSPQAVVPALAAFLQRALRKEARQHDQRRGVRNPAVSPLDFPD
jgi:hypothetical protein